jgi:hypothetical protein
MLRYPSAETRLLISEQQSANDVSRCDNLTEYKIGIMTSLRPRSCE